MSVGLRITEIRNNLKKKVFASDLGITADYLRMLEANEKNPGKTLIKLICHKYNLTEEWLTTGDGEKYSLPTVHLNYKDKSEKPLFPINVYNCETLSNNISNHKDLKNLEHAATLSMLILPEVFHSDNTIALKIENKAMEPQINKHSTVGIDLSKKAFEDGGLYLIKTKDSNLLIRNLYINAESLILVSQNKSFPEITVNKKDLDEGLIIGTVTWVLQQF